jgi:hypothetical protein
MPEGEISMNDACAYALLQLSSSELRKILMKGSIRMIKYLVMAYPHAMGASFLDALAPVLSPAALRVLVDELSRGQVLTPAQVQRAESEFIKLINQEKILVEPLVA